MVEQGRDVRLLLVGEGHFQRYRRDEERVRALAERLGVLERLDFTGRKPLADLVAELQRSAVLVLPSRAESLGMVLIDADQAGRPRSGSPTFPEINGPLRSQRHHFDRWASPSYVA